MSYAKSEAHRIPNENIGIKDERAFSKKATRVCQPQRYYAHIKVNKSKVTLDWVNTQIKNVTGGYHAPTFCRARYRIAILVPYRDRPTNLAIFLYHIHPFLQRQLAEYRIFVIEQTGRERKFNKGALFNIGFTESKKFGRWDCLIFHDVDLIPMDGRILYTCHSKPLHMASGIEDWNFVLPYNQLFGGVTMITPLHYLQANGYSNMYWNWGGEDDDFFIRLRAQRLKVNRLNSKIARYSVLSHKLQGINNFRHSILNKAKGRYKKEGLNSLQYRLIELRTEKLFTHIKADVNPFNYYTK